MVLIPRFPTLINQQIIIWIKIVDFKEYQLKANETDQKPGNDKLVDYLIPFLGLVGEMGSAVSEFKKRIRDGSAYQKKFKPQLEEELGDLLWYLSNIATKMNLDLEEIAQKNLDKTQNRWTVSPESEYALFDESFPPNERLPREFNLEFKETTGIDGTKVKVLFNGKQIGDPLTDNAHEEDGYRYHDIFHYGFVAYLGWSPVFRKLLGVKRKSDPKIDEVEDGARATFTEEAISAYLYSNAKEIHYFAGIETVDYEILKTIQKLVLPFEVSNRTAKDWEFAILESYKIFRYLRENHGGRLKINLKKRSIDVV